MGLPFAKKAFFLPKKIAFPTFRYKIVQYFNSVHAYESQAKIWVFLPLPVFNYFSCPFLFLFLDPLTLAALHQT